MNDQPIPQHQSINELVAVWHDALQYLNDRDEKEEDVAGYIVDRALRTDDQYEGWIAEDDRLEEVFELAAELEIPGNGSWRPASWNRIRTLIDEIRREYPLNFM